MLSAIMIDYASLGFMGITLFVIGTLAFVAFGLSKAIELTQNLSLSLGLFTALVNLVHFFANLSDPHTLLPQLSLSTQAVIYGLAFSIILTPLSLYLRRQAHEQKDQQTEQIDQTQASSKVDLWVAIVVIGACLIKFGLKEPLLLVNLPSLGALAMMVLLGCFTFEPYAEPNPTLARLLSLYTYSVKGAGLMLGLSLTMVFYHYKQPQLSGPLFAVAILSMCYAVVLQMFVKTRYVLASNQSQIKKDQTLTYFNQGQKTMLAFYFATLFCTLKFFSLMAH